MNRTNQWYMTPRTRALRGHYVAQSRRRQCPPTAQSWELHGLCHECHANRRHRCRRRSRRASDAEITTQSTDAALRIVNWLT